MDRKKPELDVRVIRVVTLDHLWGEDKLEVLTEMARRNHVELADMVDQILDDWAAMANRVIGNTVVQRVLKVELPPAGESE